MSEIRHGWYSDSVDKVYGSYACITPSNKTVRITHETKSKESSNKKYFPDEIYIGEIDVETMCDFRINSGYLPASPIDNGNRCHKCNHEVKERELFLSKYIGCMC